jgi:hypothetical protein
MEAQQPLRLADVKARIETLEQSGKERITAIDAKAREFRAKVRRDTKATVARWNRVLRALEAEQSLSGEEVAGGQEAPDDAEE